MYSTPSAKIARSTQRVDLMQESEGKTICKEKPKEHLFLNMHTPYACSDLNFNASLWFH